MTGEQTNRTESISPRGDTGGRHHRHKSSLKTVPTISTSGVPVLYVHPAKQGLDFKVNSDLGRPYGLIPLGLPALVNILRQNGIAVEGVNYPLERDLNPYFNLYNWLRERSGTRVILIDLHWYEHCYGAIETAKACKQALPNAWIVLGGLSASGFSAEILENFPEVDFILRGDVEMPLLNW